VQGIMRSRFTLTRSTDEIPRDTVAHYLPRNTGISIHHATIMYRLCGGPIISDIGPARHLPPPTRSAARYLGQIAVPHLHSSVSPWPRGLRLHVAHGTPRGAEPPLAACPCTPLCCETRHQIPCTITTSFTLARSHCASPEVCLCENENVENETITRRARTNAQPQAYV